MKTKTKLMVMLFMVWTVSIMAQLATNVPGGVPGEQLVTDGATDEKVKAFLTKYTWLKIFLVPLVTVIVMAAKQIISKIPIQVWPWVTPFIGVGLDYLGEKAGLWTGSMVAGAAMGGLATWFHQLGTQTREWKVEGSSPSSGKGSHKK